LNSGNAFWTVNSLPRAFRHRKWSIEQAHRDLHLAVEDPTEISAWPTSPDESVFVDTGINSDLPAADAVMLEVVTDLFNTEDCTRGFLNRAEAIDRGVQPPEMIFNNRWSAWAPRAILPDWVRSAEDVIGRMLGLGGGMCQ
jgi:hypothetical protein